MNRQMRIYLEQQNAALRAENTALRQAMLSPPCNTCNRPAIRPDLMMEEQRLRHENDMIRREIERMQSFAARYFSWSQSVSNTNNNEASSSSSAVPSHLIVSWYDLMPLAADSTNEVIRMASIGEPMWHRIGGRGNETLNLDMYYTDFLPYSPRNVEGFVHEASRATGTVAIDVQTLVEILANPNRWAEMFPSIIAKASIEAKNMSLQVMKAEFLPIVSPLVSTREEKFLRCFKQMDQNTWVIADVSLDLRSYNPNQRPGFIRFPSGYVIQRLHNGGSQVTIIEHWGYKEDAALNRLRSYLVTGLGFGAHRWLAALQRNDSISSILREISPLGKRNLVNLSRRMVNLFCTAFCGTGQNWKLVGTNRSLDGYIRIFTREIHHGGNPCILVSATGLVRMQVKPDVVFGLLSGTRNLDLWDHMRHNGDIEEIARVSRGPNLGNHISVLRIRDTCGGEANVKYVLQEAYHEALASMVIHASVVAPGMEFSGGFLPLGFAVMPGCDVGSAAAAESSPNGGDGWCDVVAGYLMIADGTTLTGEMVNVAEELVSRTLERVRNALPVNLGLR